MFEDSGMNASLNRIQNSLAFALKHNYKIEDLDITKQLLAVHGLAKSDFDFIKNTERALSENMADISIDANANKNESTIPGTLTEVTSPINKVVGYRYLYRKMVELHGKSEAKRLAGSMYDFSLALADSTKALLPYCFSIDASKIVTEGRKFGMLPSGPPKRLSSYVAGLNETVHQLSNHLAGALAIGSFFFDVAHVLIYKEGKKLDDLKDPTTRKYIENCLQSFVHSVNHLSRNASESPFTNISVFDRVKIATFLSPDNMGWYFQPEGASTSTEWNAYVTEYILELQRIFMDFFDKGDVLNGGRNFRFPVVTANISKHGKEDIQLLDPAFIEELAQREIYRYNILVSEGSKVASCCFAGETEFLSDHGLNSFDSFKPGTQLLVPTHKGGVKAAMVNTYGVQKLYKLVIASVEGDEQTLYVTKNHEWILEDGQRTKSLAVGDKLLTADFVVGDYQHWFVKSMEPTDRKELVWCLEVEDDHSFMLRDYVITGNCRLLNNFELLELGGQMNSFGGSGISLGSIRVVTINFNRIALEAKDYDDYKVRLDARIEDASKILEAHRALIKDLNDKGFQPFIKNGWLRLERMFSTLGVIGIVEAQETLQRFHGVEDDVIEYSLKRLNDKAREITIRTGNIYNIEQIPGESMAPKLAKVDRLLFGEDAVPYELYSNQFVPLWEDVGLYERMQVDGRYNQLFTGGGIVHFNLGERVLPEQATALIEYAAKVGCEHFALNPIYSECENGHTSFGKHDICPICSAPIREYYTRVVGFLVPVSCFNKVRREWEFPKRTFTAVD